MKYFHKLNIYVLFGLAIVVGAYSSAMIAAAITGERGYAFVGTLIALPAIQIISSFKLIKSSTLLTLFSAIIISTITHFASLAAWEVKWLRLNLDFYGFLDFVVIYVFISILSWVAIAIFVSIYRNRRSI